MLRKAWGERVRVGRVVGVQDRTVDSWKKGTHQVSPFRMHGSDVRVGEARGW